ncbi:MAG: tetratricopeptide repeat protein [Candidatus Hydrogenedentes bacterium]|nr:tetratricopeptide repeat protein [Candidatus Hydrogenedentota bacterium]
MKRSVKSWVILTWILIIGIFLRTIYLFYLVEAPDFIALRQDLDVQDYQARAMLSGDWNVREGVPDPQIPTTPYYRPPGYPYFLALVYYLFDGSYLAPRIINIMLGLFHIILIYALCRKMFYSATAGLCASFLVATYWAFIYYEGEVNDPAIFVFLIPCMLFCLYYAEKKHSVLLIFVGGIIIGIYAIMRPNILVYVPCALLWLVYKKLVQKNIKMLLILTLFFIIGIITVITPVTVRNYLVSGEFVPISTYFGENLLIGNSHDSDGVTPWLPYLQELEGTGNWTVWHYNNVVKGLGKQLGKEVTHSEASKIFARMAINYIIHHPFDTLKLTIRKAILFWSPKEITENKVVEGEKNFYPPLKFLPGFPVILSTFIFGIFMLFLKLFSEWHSSKEYKIDYDLLILTFLLIFSYFASFLPFFVNARARVPLLGVMLIIGGFGISEVVLSIKMRHWLKTGALISLLAILYILSNIEIISYEPDMCRWHYDRADSFLRVGRIEEAIQEAKYLIQSPEPPMTYMPFRLGHAFAKLGYPELATSLLKLALNTETSKQHPMYKEDLHYHIGAQLMKLGKYEESIGEFLQALSINPQDPRAHNDIAIAYKKLGNLKEAESHFIKSIESEKKFIIPVINLCELYVENNEFNKAEEIIKESLRFNSKSPELYYNLGVIYQQMGRYEDALKYYTASTKLKRFYPMALNNMAIIYLNHGDLQKAKEILEMCITKNPHFTLAYANYGDILYSQGEKKEALHFYLKGLETSPYNIGITSAVASVYLEFQDKENFISTIADFIESSNDTPYKIDIEGVFSGKKLDYEEALKIYNKIMLISAN